MKLTPVYVVTDSEGQAELEVDGTLEQTVEAALSAYGKHTQIVFSGDLEQMKLEKRHEDTRQERLSNPPQLPGFYESLAISTARASSGSRPSLARGRTRTRRSPPARRRTRARRSSGSSP